MGMGFHVAAKGNVTYITSPGGPNADENGYAETFAFYDGYVLFASTKQALELILVPKP